MYIVLPGIPIIRSAQSPAVLCSGIALAIASSLTTAAHILKYGTTDR